MPEPSAPISQLAPGAVITRRAEVYDTVVLGAAIIIAVLVIVIYAAIVLLEQLAVTADPSEAHARDATEFSADKPEKPVMAESDNYQKWYFTRLPTR